MFNKKQRFIIGLSHGKLTFSTLSSLSDFSTEVNDTTTTATYRRLWMQHRHVMNSSSGTCNINRLGIHYNHTQNYEIIISMWQYSDFSSIPAPGGSLERPG